MPALFFSIHMLLFLPSLSAHLSYFILAVTIRKCLGKHSSMSFPFAIAMLNGTCFSRQCFYKCTMLVPYASLIQYYQITCQPVNQAIGILLLCQLYCNLFSIKCILVLLYVYSERKLKIVLH